MSSFTDFFPAAGGGGGGFTKVLKWSTARALNDFDYHNAASYTVNPATDLGLEDGAYLGYFMVGGGVTGQGTGSGSYGTSGIGGRIIQGSKLIANASTDLVLTPGIAGSAISQSWALQSTTPPTETTISGGLTLTTADGSNLAGSAGYYHSASGSGASPGQGINGYGMGGGQGMSGTAGRDGSQAHGYGIGGVTIQYSQNPLINWVAGDGSVIFYY